LLCLTVDLDWAHDAIVADTLELIESAGVKATFFVTHNTPMIARIESAGGHELGLHPNFNPLLEGNGDRARDILHRCCQLVPSAVSVRSHSLVRSSRLAAIFRSVGITHEANYFIPPSAGGEIHIWRDSSGLVQVPTRWADDVRLIDASIGEPVDHLQCLRPLVVDFHPIHIFVNSTTVDDYEAARGGVQCPDRLREMRRPAGAGGSRDRLVALLAKLRKEGQPSCRMRDLRPQKGD